MRQGHPTLWGLRNKQLPPPGIEPWTSAWNAGTLTKGLAGQMISDYGETCTVYTVYLEIRPTKNNFEFFLSHTKKMIPRILLKIGVIKKLEYLVSLCLGTRIEW
jgi:hypothetical protein